MKFKILFAVLSLSFATNAFSGQTVDFTPHGKQPTQLAHSLEGGSDCAGCHSVHPNNQNFDSMKKFMPHNTLAGSMKANATRDPLFWAALDVANNDTPGVGDFCLRCHTPQGWLNGHVVKPTGNDPAPLNGAAGCGLQSDYISGAGSGNDFTGVTCHYCHRVDEEGPQGEAQIIGNSNAWLDDSSCDNSFEPCRKGPYKYTDNGTVGSPPHAWEYSTFIQKGEFCGSCHDVSSPELNVNGVLTIAEKLYHNGIETNLAMPIERTYSEWKKSIFSDLIYRDSLEFVMSDEMPYLVKGETCQDCHMPQSNDVLAQACVIGIPGERTGDLATHQFSGGNSWMPQVLKNTYGDDLELSNTGIKSSYDLTTEFALDMLQTKSANLELTEVANDGQTVNYDVKVTNLTGHKLPTGYPEGRRMWVNFKAVDDNGVTVFESGAYDSNTAILTVDSQIKVYEHLQGIWDVQSNSCVTTDGNNNKMFHVTKNNCIYKDNRIPPLGFTGGADVQIQPVGTLYPSNPERPQTLVNYDISNYQFLITGVAMPITVTAELKYQTTSKDYIDFLANQAIDNAFESENQTCNRSWTIGAANQSRGAFMKTLWENNNKSQPVVMASKMAVTTQQN